MFSADKFLKTECLSSYLKRSEIISAFKEFAYKDSGLKKVSSKSVLYAKELFDVSGETYMLLKKSKMCDLIFIY
ncbi:unnamed protein product [Mucor fragilis]